MTKKFNKAGLLDHSIAFFTILIWGITFINTKILETNFTALQILFIRYVIAYLALWIMHPKFLSFRSLKEELFFLGAAASGAAIYQFLENLSILYTNPASVSFITAMAPLFTAVFAFFFLKEKLNGKIIAGMIISLGGVFCISFGDSKIIETGLLGDLIIFFSIWLWAIYSVLVKKIAAFGYNGFAVTRRIFFYAILIILPFWVKDAKTIAWSAVFIPGNLFHFLYLGLFASAICFATWNRSVDRLGATVTSKYLFIMPVITLLAQLFLEQGSVGIITVLGMALILFGLLITNLDTLLPQKKNTAKTK